MARLAWLAARLVVVTALLEALTILLVARTTTTREVEEVTEEVALATRTPVPRSRPRRVQRIVLLAALTAMLATTEEVEVVVRS